MRVAYDPAKRDKTLADRGLDFEDAVLVFAGVTVEVEDIRKNYAERRVICYGTLEGRWWSSATHRVARFAKSSACERPTTVSKPVSRRTSKSDLARVDAHRISRSEYQELPELTDEMLARASVNKGGRPRSANPRQLISLRLPPEVVARWRATGPGWQTRMAERLSKVKIAAHAKGET